MKVLTPPSVFKDPMSISWARDVADVGRKWTTWNPAVRTLSGTAMDSITITAANWSLIGSLCFCVLNISFHVPVAASPLVSFYTDLPIPSLSSSSQVVFIRGQHIDNAGNAKYDPVEGLVSSSEITWTIAASTANANWYRDGLLVLKSELTGNFFYQISNQIQNSLT